ncbi:DnaC-like helicase loader [Mycobacterium phage Phrappuccino]|uniref:DnaC-like helicase loader n=1 Tax=Mycobacterium phage Phrappuccino TaxID=2591223 RepID=A0A514DDW6_9CAUD|nr:DnaC-like helicase loader [Mycobacterium phage Phrappuccino]QDH91787.1 DnaC-like helicase loader [Mycobacterium phage Phrappuccino]QIQ63229.1 DnaC-like helicase loader [Mycobacterium phage Settecandela]
MTFNIETALLTDAVAERLYRTRPELRAGPDEYCPTCRKTGVYRWQGVEHQCNCARQLQLAKHYSAAGIGATYQRLDWTDFDGNDELLAQILRYLEHHERYVTRGIGLMFHGPIGTGKTMAANLVLKELIKRGYSGFATTFANTVEAFTSTWGNRDEKEWFARKFMQSQVLLLDDLGREFRAGVNLPQSTFDMILRTRVQEGRPTLLTTNCTLGELETGYGSAVLSMLKEQSIKHEFRGNDFRPTANRRTLTEVEAEETRPLV